MNEPTIDLGKLGPQWLGSKATLQRITIEDSNGQKPGRNPGWRTGTFLTLQQENAGLGRFTFMIEELPKLITQLQALVPVVDQLAALATPSSPGVVPAKERAQC